MQRKWTARELLVWGLSIVLAIQFLAAGIPKVLGSENAWVQAFAMWGYPEWFRVVVGIAEIACGILLLVPAAAPFAAIVLAIIMTGALFTRLASATALEDPRVWTPAILLVLLLVVAWLRIAPLLHRAKHVDDGVAHSVLREGIIAGVIGATGVAVWFLIVDTIGGRPLFTPATLGRALFSVLGPVPTDGGSYVLDATALHVFGYTVFHYAAFIAVGMLAVYVVHVAETEPSILIGFVILFVAFEIAFHALVAVLQETTVLGALAWYQVMAGNLIAAVMMGTYLWRTHPALKEEFAHAVDGSP